MSTPRRSFPRSWWTNRATRSIRSGSGNYGARPATGRDYDDPQGLARSVVRAIPRARSRQRRRERPRGHAQWVFRLFDGATNRDGPSWPTRTASRCASSSRPMRHGLHVLRDRTGGFTRHLSAGEVLEQVMFRARAAAPRRLFERGLHGHGRAVGELSRDDGRRTATARVSKSGCGTSHTFDVGGARPAMNAWPRQASAPPCASASTREQRVAQPTGHSSPLSHSNGCTSLSVLDEYTGRRQFEWAAHRRAHTIARGYRRTSSAKRVVASRRGTS